MTGTPSPSPSGSAPPGPSASPQLEGTPRWFAAFLPGWVQRILPRGYFAGIPSWLFAAYGLLGFSLSVWLDHLLKRVDLPPGFLGALAGVLMCSYPLIVPALILASAALYRADVRPLAVLIALLPVAAGTALLVEAYDIASAKSCLSLTIDVCQTAGSKPKMVDTVTNDCSRPVMWMRIEGEGFSASGQRHGHRRSLGAVGA